MNDFDVVVDPTTGRAKLTLKKEFVEKLGISDVAAARDLIEAYVDENGEQKLRLKDGAQRLKIGKQQNKSQAQIS